MSLAAAPEYGNVYLADAEQPKLTKNKTIPFSKVDGICGFTQDGDCSLLAAIMVNEGGLSDFSTNRRVSNLNYNVWAAVMGMHVDSPDAKCIESSAFYFSKIRQLLPTPWTVKMRQEGNTFVAPLQAVNLFQFKNAALNAEIICEVFAGGGTKFKKGIDQISAEGEG